MAVRSLLKALGAQERLLLQGMSRLSRRAVTERQLT